MACSTLDPAKTAHRIKGVVVVRQLSVFVRSGWQPPPSRRSRSAPLAQNKARRHLLTLLSLTLDKRKQAIEKESLRRKEKLRIAACAAGLVKEGQVVILDSGTTTTAIGRALRNFRNVTIVTNAVNIAAELSGASVEVILTGGTLRKNSFSLVGPIAEEALHRLNADILFLGVDGFDVHYGLSTPNLLEAKVNRVMVEAAKRTVAVCDSSKFGRRSLSLIVPTSALQEVITDRGIPKSDLRALKKSGLEVTLV